MRQQFNWPRLIAVTGGFCLGVWVWYTVAILLLGLAGCATNPCRDNPRNMQCMSPAELERALGG